MNRVRVTEYLSGFLADDDAPPNGHVIVPPGEYDVVDVVDNYPFYGSTVYLTIGPFTVGLDADLLGGTDVDDDGALIERRGLLEVIA